MNNKFYYTGAQIRQMLNLANSTLYQWISEGRFPKQIKLGAHKAVWSKEAVDQWIKEKGIQEKTSEFDDSSFQLGFQAALNHVKNLLYVNREYIGVITIDYIDNLIYPEKKEQFNESI